METTGESQHWIPSRACRGFLITLTFQKQSLSGRMAMIGDFNDVKYCNPYGYQYNLLSNLLTESEYEEE